MSCDQSKPADEGKSRFPAFLILGIKLLVAVGLLGVLASRVHLGEAWSALAEVSLGLWLKGVVLNALVLLVGAWRWHCTAFGRIPMSICLVYSWIGHFYATVLPGAVAGDVAKTAVLAASREQHRNLNLAVSVALDRLLGLISLLLVVAAGLVELMRQQGFHPLLWLAVLLVSVVCCVCAPFFMTWLLSLFQRLNFLPYRLVGLMGRTADIIRQAGGPRWLFLLALSLLMHGLAGSLFAMAARELGMQAEFWRLCLFYAATNVAIMLPVTIAGVGAREQLSIWILGGGSSAAVMPVTLSWFLLLASAAHALLGGFLQLAVWWRDAARAKRAGTP